MDAANGVLVPGSKFSKSGPDKLTVTLKNGGAVDPDSGLGDSTRVLKVRGEWFPIYITFKLFCFFSELGNSNGGPSPLC